MNRDPKHRSFSRASAATAVWSPGTQAKRRPRTLIFAITSPREAIATTCESAGGRGFRNRERSAEGKCADSSARAEMKALDTFRRPHIGPRGCAEGGTPPQGAVFSEQCCESGTRRTPMKIRLLPRTSFVAAVVLLPLLGLARPAP